MGREPSARNTGIVLVLMTAAISGVSTFVNFWAVQGTTSDAFVAVRNTAVAGALLVVAVAASGGRLPRLSRRDAARLAVIGLVGGAVPFVLFFRGLQMAATAGGAATATFGYRALFLFAAVGAVVYLKEAVPRRWAIGAGAILAGNFALLSLTVPLWSDGTALVLAATALWAGEYALSRRALSDLPATTVAWGRMGFGAAFLLVWLLATSGPAAASSLTGDQWVWVAVSGALLAAFVSTWYAGLARLDLASATALLALAFPITWALGALSGHGPVTPLAAAGAAAVALGAVAAVGAGTVGGALRGALHDGLDGAVGALRLRRVRGAR